MAVATGTEAERFHGSTPNAVRALLGSMHGREIAGASLDA
jgi:hypothetical protein